MEKKKTIAKAAKKKPLKKEIKPKEKPVIKEEVLAVSAADFPMSSEEEMYLNKDKKARRYFEGVGRRKTAIARVRLLTIKPFEGDEGKITVNDKFYKQYFPTGDMQQIAEAALRKLKSLNRFEVVARISGGGIHAQAEALRHGLARALVIFNLDFRKKLKKAGYLKRDPRAKERRKYGLKKARKSPQWAKR